MKPVSKITDRAKRYRANSKALRPLPPKQCGFCGSKKHVGVHHVNGLEGDLDPQNLMWACKRCNTQIGLWMRNAGLGRRVRQLNPAGSKRAQMDAYAAAIKVMRGEFEGDVGKAVAVIRSTPRALRSAYTSRTWPTRRAIYGPAGRAVSGDLPF